MKKNVENLPLRGAFTALLLAAALTPVAALAQEPPAQETEGQLEEVIVTAERRAENIRDVPNSVSTVSGEDLDVLSTGGQDVRLLAGRVPSLNVESSFGRAFPRFYIRGYGNGDFRLNASQPVSLIYDDVVQENPILKGFPIFDLDQIEVLRGPQGTLFGRNTPGGVVKFDSVKPDSDFGGYVNVSDATYNTANIEGAINIPLRRGLGGCASRRSTSIATTTSATRSPARTTSTRATTIAPRACRCSTTSDNFSALFNAHMRNLDGTARLFRANIIESGSNDLDRWLRCRQPRLRRRPEPAGAEHRRRQHPAALGFRRSGAVLDHRLRIDGRVQPRRHRWRLRLRVLRLAERTRLHSVPERDGGWHPHARSVHPGSAPGIAARPARSTGRRACTTSMRTTTPSSSRTTVLAVACRTNTCARTRPTRPGRCSVRSSYKVTDGIRAARRRSLHGRREGFRHGHAGRIHVSRSDSAHHRQPERRQRELGSGRHVLGQRCGQPVRARRDGLPRRQRAAGRSVRQPIGGRARDQYLLRSRREGRSAGPAREGVFQPVPL